MLLNYIRWISFIPLALTAGLIFNVLIVFGSYVSLYSIFYLPSLFFPSIDILKYYIEIWFCDIIGSFGSSGAIVFVGTYVVPNAKRAISVFLCLLTIVVYILISLELVETSFPITTLEKIKCAAGMFGSIFACNYLLRESI
tara:strand:- start:671 stop:1093 length:423 start_codon:yes stop_codon:yes gene_type:complete